jgi:hypothetical protein
VLFFLVANVHQMRSTAGSQQKFQGCCAALYQKAKTKVPWRGGRIIHQTRSTAGSQQKFQGCCASWCTVSSLSSAKQNKARLS